MGTYLALWKTDSLYQLLDGVELQGSQAQLAGNLIYHSLILRRVVAYFSKILVGIALKLLDDTTGNQLHITLEEVKLMNGQPYTNGGHAIRMWHSFKPAWSKSTFTLSRSWVPRTILSS